MSKTSVITMTFRDFKDFDVKISDIDHISPRGMELAFNLVEKEFLVQKGIASGKNRAAEKERADVAAAAAEKEAALKQLEAEEIANRRNTIRKAAQKRFEEAEKDEREAILNAVEDKLREADTKKLQGMLEEVVSESDVTESEDPEKSMEELLAEAVASSSGDPETDPNQANT